MNVLITGTSRGLGFTLAEILLEEGHVVYGVSRKFSELKHSNYTHYECDLEDTKAIRLLADKIEKVDVLINSAGVAKLNPFLLSVEEDYERILKTNLIAPYVLTQEISKKMIFHKFGRIINITTIGTALNLKGEVQYLTSKAALEKFTEILAKELFPFGITVNNLGISLMQTDLIKGLTQAQIDSVKAQLIAPDFLERSDLKHMINFLMHKDAKSVTGQTINFGGV